MDENHAKELAKNFLAKNIELMVHHEIPPGIYLSDMVASDVIVMSFSLFTEPHRLGSSKYVIVSKRDGSVRFAGHQGE